jgi:G:T/U-mismatch repair DNA glycosylase
LHREDVENGTKAVIHKVKEVTQAILNNPSSEGVIIICTGQNDEEKAEEILLICCTNVIPTDDSVSSAREYSQTSTSPPYRGCTRARR